MHTDVNARAIGKEVRAMSKEESSVQGRKSEFARSSSAKGRYLLEEKEIHGFTGFILKLKSKSDAYTLEIHCVPGFFWCSIVGKQSTAGGRVPCGIDYTLLWIRFWLLGIRSLFLPLGSGM